MMRLLLLCLGLLLNSSIVAQHQLDSLFQKGNQAYAQAQYTEAVAAYEKALEATERSAALHNNLGLAYLGKKHLAHALLHFERALRLRPDLQDAQHNLRVAQQYQSDEIYAAQPFLLLAWWQDIRSSASSNTWAILCLLTAFLLAATWIWRWQRSASWFLPAAVFALWFMLASLAKQAYQQEHYSDAAIVMTEEAVLHQEPQIGSPSVRNLHAGAKVELLEQEGDWQRVRLANAQVGWILAEVVEQI